MAKKKEPRIKDTVSIVLEVPEKKYYRVKEMASAESPKKHGKYKKTIHDKFIEILNEAIKTE